MLLPVGAAPPPPRPTPSSLVQPRTSHVFGAKTRPSPEAVRRRSSGSTLHSLPRELEGGRRAVSEEVGTKATRVRSPKTPLGAQGGQAQTSAQRAVPVTSQPLIGLRVVSVGEACWRGFRERSCSS